MKKALVTGITGQDQFKHYRSEEVDLLVGDATKTKRDLGREPKMKFQDLARIMVDEDIELLKREKMKAIYVLC